MRVFQWQGIDSQGNLIKASIFGTDKSTTRFELQSKGIILIYFKRCIGVRIQQKTLLRFFQQFALLLNAELQIDSALSVLLQTESNPLLQAIINSIKTLLFQGLSLHQALGKFSNYFPRDYIAFIEAGEMSGSLQTALTQLADYLERQLAIHQQIQKTLRYPIFMLCCLITSTLGIFYWIIPQYQEFFSELGGHLPALTQYLLDFTQLLQQHSLFILICVVLNIFSLWKVYHQPRLRFFIDRNLLILPLFRSLVIQAGLTRWFGLMALACKAHLPILQALILANRSLKNKALQKDFSRLPIELSQGSTCYDALTKLAVCYPEALQLIAIGENTGQLGECFAKLAHYYRNLLNNSLEKLVQALEPTLLLLLAIIAGVVVSALYLPMINFGLHLR